MITYEQALKKILQNIDTLPAEKVSLEDSTGRIIKEDVYSAIEMPPFNKSAMDGYAVKASEVKIIPAKLKSVSLIQAGEAFKGRLGRNECVKIMTGAPLPEGLDAVVMVENTRSHGESVEITKAVRKWENVCFQGEDLKFGQKVIEKGTTISSSEIAALATVGRKFIKAIKKPRVAVLNTGGEIVPAGTKLGKNKIYNSNGPMLCALVKSDGIEPKFLGIIKDNKKELKKAISGALKKSDIVLISGGVSEGDYDFVPGVLRTLGAREIFHKANIKPGKPIFFGIKNKTAVFGIPGNPVSNFLAYFIFIRPALYKMMGYRCRGPEVKEGAIERDFRIHSKRKHFILVKITEKENRYYLNPVDGHGSADIMALAKADGFMMMPEGARAVKKNSKLQFITWKTK